MPLIFSFPSLFLFLQIWNTYIFIMALPNINNLSADLPSIFQESSTICPQIKCMNAIKELKIQISDNKTRYVYLNQQIKLNKNKRIELQHTIRTHKLNKKKLENFEKLDNPCEDKLQKAERDKQQFVSSIKRIRLRRANLRRVINKKQQQFQLEVKKEKLQIENLRKNHKFLDHLRS